MEADQESRVYKDWRNWRLNPQIFLQSITSLGTVQDRPVCRSVELSDAPVHKFETGPGGRSSGCVSGSSLSDWFPWQQKKDY